MGLLAWLGSAFASALGYSAVRFVAWKLVLYTFIVTVFPIIFTNIVYSLIQKSLTLVSSAQAGFGVQGHLLMITGLAAWLADKLQLVQAFSLIISAIIFRLSIRLIPFVRL